MFSTTTRGSGEPVVQPRLPASTTAKRITVGTDQQEALWAELVDGTSNVIVEARAGTGKSTACREGMYRILDRYPDAAITYTVFGNANAEEFRQSAPPGVEVGTAHGLGYAALKRAFQSRLEKQKSYLILDETTAGRSLARYLRKSIAMLVGHAKNQALRPDTPHLLERLVELTLHFEINVYGQPWRVAEWATKVLTRAAEWVELVDFDDMIWLPTLHDVEFPHRDLVFLDEVQDWNPAQHALIPRLCRSGRVVAVGDRFQAIYAWRGADVDSLGRLESLLGSHQYGLRKFPLTVTFRCPRRHVALAQSIVSDLVAHDSNRDGELVNCSIDQAVANTRYGDLVICPLNAPLVSAALQLIGQGRRTFVRGRKLGDQLIGVVRGCGACRTTGELSNAIERWRGREIARLSEMENVDDLIESVLDRAAGLQAVVSACQTPADVEPAILSLFDEEVTPSEDCVVFSTIHRAKGLEADRVIYLQAPTRPPTLPWQIRQAANLHYVGLTRSKWGLTLAT